LSISDLCSSATPSVSFIIDARRELGDGLLGLAPPADRLVEFPVYAWSCASAYRASNTSLGVAREASDAMPPDRA